MFIKYLKYIIIPLIVLGSFPSLSYEPITISETMRVGEALAEGQRLRSLIVIGNNQVYNHIDLLLLDIERLINHILQREGTKPSISRMQALYLGAMTYALLEDNPRYRERKIYYEDLWRKELIQLEQRNPGNAY